MRASFSSLFASPVIKRLVWYSRRAQKSLDRRFFVSLGMGIFIFTGIAAVAVTLLEKPWTVDSLGTSFYWGITTIFGQGDSSYITSPGGWLVSWLLILFGVALLGTITGALVAFVIDFLLKEGQGMGAAGYADHIVICGWNSTARDLVDELQHDEYTAKIVLVHDADRNPAGGDVYYVRGDATHADDLERAGIETAMAAVVFPADGSDAADMRSILIVMAIEAMAPDVRTVVEVNNPRHEVHLKRANADEVLVTSQLASHLLARSALYPGLSEPRHRHRVGRRGRGAVPRVAPRGVLRPHGGRPLRHDAPRPPRDAPVDQPRRPHVRQPARGLQPARGRRRRRPGGVAHAPRAAPAGAGGSRCRRPADRCRGAVRLTRAPGTISTDVLVTRPRVAPRRLA